jgi:hypothetical protein
LQKLAENAVSATRILAVKIDIGVCFLPTGILFSLMENSRRNPMLGKHRRRKL